MNSYIKIRQIIKKEKKSYLESLSFRNQMIYVITRNQIWMRYRFLKHARLYSFYSQCVSNGKKICKPLKIYHLCKKNILGYRLNYEIDTKNIGEGLYLCHNGPIVINPNAVVGDNCILHGDNCIGNDGKTNRCPIIGNNVEIGVGAKVLGEIVIANNIIIGAGSIVVSSFEEEGITIAGVPARKLK